MKKNTQAGEPVSDPTEDGIREYAYYLYEQRGCTPNHDLDDWLEAEACISANIPKGTTRTRLHHHARARVSDKSNLGKKQVTA